MTLHWPADSLEFIRECAKAGLSASATCKRMAEHYGRPISRSAVLGKAWRAKIKFKGQQDIATPRQMRKYDIGELLANMAAERRPRRASGRGPQIPLPVAARGSSHAAIPVLRRTRARQLVYCERHHARLSKGERCQFVNCLPPCANAWRLCRGRSDRPGPQDWWRSQAVWSRLSPVQREALDADCVKCARIAHGDHNAIEHWEDRAGYARWSRSELGRRDDDQHRISSRGKGARAVTGRHHCARGDS